MQSVGYKQVHKYTLIITEKPDAAKQIATALDEQEKPKKKISKGVPYYTAYREGYILVVPALGHLYTIKSNQKGIRDYPVFDYNWAPIHHTKKGAYNSYNWLKAISELSKNAESFVDGCDYDIEGSIIGFTILKYACNGKHEIAKRMKYSTLTKEELRKAYKNLLPKLDFKLIDAGLTRHEIDWLYGVNLSRALTQAYEVNSGKYSTLSTGRVQGPTLKFLEQREKDIQCFVPIPRWKLTAEIRINGIQQAVDYEKTIEVLTEAKKIRDECKTRNGKIDLITVKESVHEPPLPFDLSSIQSEAHKIFKYTPMSTANILQSLYLDALISYPRTSSQKLPESIGYIDILKKIGKAPVYAKHVDELLNKTFLKPNEGKKIDTAHPAIYPTGNSPQKLLDSKQRNLFDLIIKRFLATFGDPAIRQTKTVWINLNGKKFFFITIKTLVEGWFRFYEPYVKMKEDTLPNVLEGQTVDVKRIVLKRYFTCPPPRYNPRSLLLKMENEGIGTKATRASTIQILNERKYIKGSNFLEINELGFVISEVLEKYCPIIVTTEMTKRLEEKMDSIQEGKNTKQNVLNDAIDILKTITTELKMNETKIGAQLNKTVKEANLREKIICSCRNCQSGKLIILRSKKTGKRFVGCTNFFEGKCNISYPLPQKGTIKPLKNQCRICGSPTILVYFKDRNSMRLCLNLHCPQKGKRNCEMQNL